MIRTIIRIDENACDGCGLCVEACHEGALALVDGKARLLHDHYCDGLGDCLPACPKEAITFETREAAAYDEEAVKAHRERQREETLACGCPSHTAKTIIPQGVPDDGDHSVANPSQLQQWPVQLRLVAANAPAFKDCDLLVAADCSAYSYGDFHRRFMRGRPTVIGCPKLDSDDQVSKLTAIIQQNNIRSVTVTRMEVPCCGGLENAVRQAIDNSGKEIPLKVVTITATGEIV